MDGWKCAGCGKPSPGREESCDCPTRVVSQSGATAWKLPAGAFVLTERCHDLIARLFENPKARLKTEDVDLIRASLQQYASAQDSEIARLRAIILNIQALAESGFPIDSTKLATRCRQALS